MRSRLVVLVAFAVAAVAVGFAAARFVAAAPPARPPAAHATLPTAKGAYLGVYEAGTPPNYQPVAEFAAAAGTQPNLIGYYSGWIEPFNTKFANMSRSHGATPFVQIDPTDASLPDIAAGEEDSYLRQFADGVADFGHAVVIGFGHEMNSGKYSWGYGHVPAATFVKAWRHIVTIFRAEGADNVTWLWTLEADAPGTGPIADWWPGSQYVTWIGIDGYYYRSSDTFSSVFGKTIDQVRQLTGKPVLLSETAVGPQAGQTVKILDLFHGMADYDTLGVVWFDIAQHDGLYHQDWRIEDNQAAEYAFRLGVRDELTLVSAGQHS